MNDIQKLLHSPEIQEKLHIKSAHIPLSADKKRQLGNAYLKLYFGLSCANWANKKSLGASWQTALTQINNIINARDEKNPAVQFLKIMHGEHKSRWPKHIMTHPQRDSMLADNGIDAVQWREYAMKNIKSAMGEVTLLMAQCGFNMEKSQQRVFVSGQKNKTPERVAANKIVQQPETLAMKAPEQDAKQMSVDAKQKQIIPQTKNGEQVAAKPGINSVKSKTQDMGANSKQIAVRPVEKERSMSEEEKQQEMIKRIKKSAQQNKMPNMPKTEMKAKFQQGGARVIDLSEMIRMRLLMQQNQKAA